MVAACHPAVLDRRYFLRQLQLGLVQQERRVARWWSAGAHHAERVLRGGRAAVHLALPKRALRVRHGPEPVGLSGDGLCVVDDRPLPSVPPRAGRRRPSRRGAGDAAGTAAATTYSAIRRSEPGAWDCTVRTSAQMT